MKGLFITFMPFKDGAGITKKINAEYEALVKHGMDMQLSRMVIDDNKERTYRIGDHIIDTLGTGLRGTINFFIKYNGLHHYVKENRFDFVYIRYILTGNPWFLSFLKELKKLGIKIVMEIPTYPYDSEFSHKAKYRFQKFVENLTRKRFYKYVDRIITFSSDDVIFNIPTIRISNSVDANAIPLRTKTKHSSFNMVGVAMLAPWHGFDRMIRSIAEYYKNGGDIDIHFYIIGRGLGLEGAYVQLAADLGISSHIHIEGVKNGDALNAYFNNTDIAVGSLGRHRSGVAQLKTLKNVEYAMRGIPFIYSESNPDFDDKEYIMKAEPDESMIDISELMNFTNQLKMTPTEIRQSVEGELTWDKQMKIVVDELIKI